MDGYLNYKINLYSTRLMEVEEFTPTDVGTYNDLINMGQEWYTENQESVSSSIQMVDMVIGTYVTLGLNNYLTVTSHQDNQIVETFSDDSLVFTSSLYGNNLLSGSFPLELTGANFNFTADNSTVDIGLSGDININSLTDWSGFYSEMNIIAATLEDTDYLGNHAEVKITALEDNSKFTISGNQLSSNGLIELSYNGYNSTPQNPVLESRRVFDANIQLTDTATLGDIPYIYNFDYKSYEATSQIDGTQIIIPQIIDNNIWTTFNNLNSNEITSPVNIEFHLPRTDYAFSLPFTLTNYDDLFDLRGIDFTVDMGAGNDTATVYEDHGIINGGAGEDKVNFATINESSASINLVNDQGIEYYEVTDQSLGTPRTIKLADVELVKFADQSNYVDINSYINKPPSIESSSFIIIGNNTSIDNPIYKIIANDLDEDTLSYNMSGADSSYFTIDNSNGEIRIINSPNFEIKSKYLFDVDVSDGAATDTKSIMVFVDNLDTASSDYSTSNFNINDLNLNKIYDTFYHHDEILIYAQDDTSQKKLIKLKDNGEITHEMNLGAHPDFWNSIFSNSTFGSLNNSETLVEIYEIDTTSGLSGVLLRDPETLNIISTFETIRTSGSKNKDQDLIIHEDVIYIAEKTDGLIYSSNGTTKKYEFIILNKYDEQGNEIGLKDSVHYSYPDKNLEIIGFNILNDGDDDQFHEVFIQFAEINENVFYTKMGNTTVGYNSNLLPNPAEPNSFSNEIIPLVESGFVVNNPSVYQDVNNIGNLNDKNVEIYVKNSSSSNFDNAVSYLNGNNFIPIGFDNDQIIGDKIHEIESFNGEQFVILSSLKQNTDNIYSDLYLQRFDYLGREIGHEVLVTNFYIPENTNTLNFDDEDKIEIILKANDSISVLYENFENSTSNPSLSLFKFDIENAPTITSIDLVNIDENSSLESLIYDAEAIDKDNDQLIFSISGNDSNFFTIDSNSGEVRLISEANYENKSFYTINIHVSDLVYTDTLPITILVNDINEAPTISLSQSSITLDELKDGSAGSSTTTSTLSLDFSSIISINDSGGTVLLSYRILDDDAVYEGLANEQGDTSQNTYGINTSAITPDAYGSINLASNDLSNLEFTFDRDYSGSFYIEFQVVETLNNRFVSSDTALEDRRILVTINPTSDTPDLSVANVSGVEDDAFIPLTISSSSTDESETVTVYLEKPSQVVKFINTTTNAEVGTSTTFDFGSGSVSAVALTAAELTNLGIVTGGDVKSDFTIEVLASSSDGDATPTYSSSSTVSVSMEPKADQVGIDVNNSSSSSVFPNSDENSIISIPIKLNLNDPTEVITLSIGNFRDADGNTLLMDRSLDTAFRPVSFTRNNETTDFEDVSLITLNNNFFTFNTLSMSDLVADAISGDQFEVNFLPITNFNGLIEFDFYATAIEPNAVTSDYASSQTNVITLTQTIGPVTLTASIDKWGGSASSWLDGPSMKLYRKDIADEVISLVSKPDTPGHKYKPDIDKGSYELRVEHDQDTDGAINIDDVMGVLSLSRGIIQPNSNEHKLAADWNGDGIINIDDVMGVLSRSRGIVRDDEWRFHDKASNTSLWDNATKTNKMDIVLEGDDQIDLTAILRGDVNASYNADQHNRADPSPAPTPNYASLPLNNDDELLTINPDIV
ncbi:cadherin repeat domain-containing protein [bacterium]|nr:cadherin repeat domain-containing protein [bacterium]